jgi:hypothetical protein
VSILDNDPVHSPAHYSRLDPEPIEVIESWGLGFHLAQVLKYIARAGHKDPAKEIEDLRKAKFYLERKIAALEGSKPARPARPTPSDGERLYKP